MLTQGEQHVKAGVKPPQARSQQRPRTGLPRRHQGERGPADTLTSRTIKEEVSVCDTLSCQPLDTNATDVENPPLTLVTPDL